MSAILTPPTPTAAPPISAVPPNLAGGYEPVRLSVAQFVRMGETGILEEDPRIELIDGQMVRKPVENPPHADILYELALFIGRLHGDAWTCRSQNQVNLDTTAPAPDIAILRGPRAVYRVRHAGPADIVFVAEVSASTIAFDRTAKLRMYARNGIPVYWIVNVSERRIEVYTRPVGEAYQDRIDYTAGQTVPVVLDGQTVAEFPVSDIFG